MDQLLLRKLTPAVIGVLVRRGVDFATAEDAVQEALIQAALTWPDRQPADPKGWLVTVAWRKVLDARRSALLENFPYGALTPAQLQTFLAEYAPITEQRSGPYLQYDMFTAWYGIYRDLDTFDLRENERLGPSVSLRAGLSAPALGADFLTYPLSGTIGWAAGPAGAFFRASITGSTRLRAGTAIDQIFQGKLYLASPLWRRLFRLVLAGEADAARADTQRTIFFLGGDSGLRGYAIGDLQGTSMVIAHAELRSAPLAVRSQRIGALLFYDIGDAAPSFGSMRIRSDTGIGLRWLIPQLNSSVLRVDWAVPLENGTVTPAGFPGRATAGFQPFGRFLDSRMTT